MTVIPEFSNQGLIDMKTLYWDDFICAIHGASFLASGGGAPNAWHFVTWQNTSPPAIQLN